MDLYDPQTVGVMVFGGFVVISAIGIFLVSTFSMKETSYEEALAKQRKELEKSQQQKVEKKKKEKPIEKKGKAKKKEDKPNGKIPEQEPAQDVIDTSKDVEPEVALVAESLVTEPTIVAISAPAPEKAALSPKDKKKKEKKVAKAEPAPSPAATLSQTIVSKPLPVLEVIAKEVPVISASPVGVQPSTPVANSVPMKKVEANLVPMKKVEANSVPMKKVEMNSVPMKKVEVIPNVDELKHEVAAKKKNVAKKKSEPIVTDSDGPLYLSYKTLVSTISSTVFSEGEAQRLAEILTEKAGIIQDTWHTATQKGDPMTILKRQLEEKEKQLATEHEDATAAKNKLRELSKELATEKSRASGVEIKLKEQLVAREQEINAVQTRMQTSYQDHVNEVQQLQGKIRTLQEQLENGPNAQLARLQQENSILRDALNQATSQMESKQNAELAKLRQECSKLTKELAEKSESLQQEEWARKSLDAKTASYEKQVNQLQVSQQETEESFKKRLDEMAEELRKSQTSCKTLLTEAEKSKGDQQIIVDLQTKLMSSEAEVKQKFEDLTSVKEKLAEANTENLQLAERIKSIEVLLEAGQGKEVEKSEELQAAKEAKEAEITQLHARLEEKDSRVSLLEKEVMVLKDSTEQQRIKNNDLREKNWQAMEALRLAEKSCEEKLTSFTKIQEEAAHQLNAVETQTKEMLQSLFPQVTVIPQEVYSEWLQEFGEKILKTLNQQNTKTETSDLSLRLKEAEEVQSTLQAECDQYRTILAETEGMLKDLQKSVEEEEQVWNSKLSTAEEELQKSHLEVKFLEETVEKLKSDLQTTEQFKEYISLMEAQLETQMNSASSECQNYSKEVEILRQLLSESQEQLDAAKTEAQKQSKELALLESQLVQTETNLEDEQALRQKLAEEFEESQKLIFSLQVELEKLRAGGDSAGSDTEEALQLKERLEKEKKLTRDLGHAATKLQQLLKVTQEQLAKERETVKTLKNQLQETGEDNGMKEGTSV
ncbi:ribosome-binding protein 1 isoform X2 [Microcaecilia unicolor]|uniref:Ribosome-binding protein 1 isoform X2 n=1 Tax=Microcaecilia unicolor TaxID=1415580 RepID=A0A6P7XNA5_9AMPH|nr:ribosome-binding protein 1 isoform X2 [Microcaecilia unicolor]